MNVRSQGQDSTVTTAEHLGFPSVWFWMGCANSLLSHICIQIQVQLVLLCCLVNVTLLSPYPINREQVIHPVAIQHPMKLFPIPEKTVRYWCLLLAHPTNRNKCTNSKIHKMSTRCWFRVLKVTTKIWVLKWTQSTMLCCIFNMTNLTVVSCVMNAWNWSCQLCVTRLCPFSDWSSKVVCWPLNVWSTNSCKIQAFQHNLWADFDSSPTDSSSSFLTWWSSNQELQTFVTIAFVHSCFGSFDTMFTDHNISACPSNVIGPHHISICRTRFVPPWYLTIAPTEFRDSNISLKCPTIASFVLHGR